MKIIDEMASGCISAKFTICPNYTTKSDCYGSNGASNTKVLGGYFEVSAPTTFHYMNPFSS